MKNKTLPIKFQGKEKCFFENPGTGSVDTLENWFFSYCCGDSTDEDGEDMSFEVWGADQLIEVEQDEDGEWTKA